MAKMVKCKTCGADIAKSANVCPSCGAKQHQVAKSICAVIAVFTIFLCLMVVFGGDDSSPEKVGEVNVTPQSEESTAQKEPEKNVFNVGDKVELNDIIVTLVDVSESNGRNYMSPSSGNVFVLCEFEIENNSTQDIGVSSILSFSAYIDDYTANMSLSAIVSSEKTQLDGTVAPGKKMTGVVGYEAGEDWQNIEIRFTPSFWSNKEIIFAYEK